MERRGHFAFKERQFKLLRISHLRSKEAGTHEEPGVRGGVGSGEGGGRHWTDSTVFWAMYAGVPGIIWSAPVRSVYGQIWKEERTDHRSGQGRTHKLDEGRVVPVGRNERARVSSRGRSRHDCSAAGLDVEARRGKERVR